MAGAGSGLKGGKLPLWLCDLDLFFSLHGLCSPCVCACVYVHVYVCAGVCVQVHAYVMAALSTLAFVSEGKQGWTSHSVPSCMCPPGHLGALYAG